MLLNLRAYDGPNRGVSIDPVDMQALIEKNGVYLSINTCG